MVLKVGPSDRDSGWPWLSPAPCACWSRSGWLAPVLWVLLAPSLAFWALSTSFTFWGFRSFSCVPFCQGADPRTGICHFQVTPFYELWCTVVGILGVGAMVS